jgi:hypothetical protein
MRDTVAKFWWDDWHGMRYLRYSHFPAHEAVVTGMLFCSQRTNEGEATHAILPHNWLVR